LAKNSTGKNGTGQPGRGGPQSRKPVTLDLPSEEVARKEAENAAASASGDKPTSSDKTAAGGKASAESAAKPAGEAPAAGGKPEPAQAQAGSAKSAEQAAAKPAATPKSEARGKPVEPQTPSAFASGSRSEKAPSAAPAPASRGASFASLVAAALVGAVVAAVVVVLALNGFFRPPAVEAPDYSGDIATLKQDVDALKATGAENDLAPLRSDITALQQSVSALQNAPAPAAPDDSALKALQDRVAQLEQRVSQAASGVASGDGAAPAAPDLSGVESAIDDLKQQLAALSTKVDGLPDSDRVQSIEANVQSIEQSVQAAQTQIQSMETELSKVSGEMDTAHVLAPAVAADALAAAIETGRPFTSELTALESLGVDPDKLAPLKPDAEAGLPTLAAIRARFEAEIEGVDLATQLPEETGAIDRLLQSARGLVDVRPVQPTEGTDPAAIVTRIRAALAAGDLKTALSEWSTLPDDIKTETAGWAKLAETRAAADDLVAELRASALSLLGSDG
jgi:hypothetical protein